MERLRVVGVNMKTISLFTLCIFSLNTFAKDGRFQLIQGKITVEEDRLLDSQSGKIWKRSCVAILNADGRCTAHIWVPEAVEGISTTKERADYIEAEQKVAERVNNPKS